MTGFKVTGFRGIAPKVSSELLPEASAQTAHNCKLYSGDIIPYPEPVVAGNHGRTGNVNTIYPLHHPTTNAHVWMSWTNTVDVATPSFSDNADEQRFYYTGDGYPKVSTYALATSGTAPYPTSYYRLGLTAPSTYTPSAVVTSFSTVSVSSIARDAGGVATFVTSTAHGLRTGVVVNTSNFTHMAGTYSRTGTTITVTINNHGIASGSSVSLDFTTGTATDGVYTVTNVTTNTFDVIDSTSGATSGDVRLDARSFNVQNAEVTVVNSTTFTVFAPGFQIATFGVSQGSVDLGGEAVPREYVYTWYTPWGEESIASEPSSYVITREGQTVTVYNLPIIPPSVPSNNFIRGIRLYRTLSSEVEADFFLLQTLWFPTGTASVSRTNNVSSVTLAYPHNFIEDDRFKLTSCTNSSFNIADGVVTEIVDDYTFKYNQAGVDVASTADTTGILYHDIAQSLSDTPVYWGHTTYDFVDTFDSRFLTSILESDDYDPPPDDLQGLKTIQNNILVGFKENAIYFSEPNKPHAWPLKYLKAIDFNIVAIEPLSGVGAIVLTEGYPYLISGNDPDIMTIQRVDALYPCLSARGVVAMSYGVVYPTYEGLAVYSAASGPRLITAAMYEQDTWSAAYDPTSVVAVYFGDAYFASHSTGSFIFQYEQNSGGTFTTCDQEFTAAFNDKLTNRMFFTAGVNGDIYEWDNAAQPRQTAVWKSRTIILNAPDNLGAARIVADYETGLQNWDQISTNWESLSINWDTGSTVTFDLYADKSLVLSTGVTNSRVFRLPTGYKSDTYEFRVTSDIRVRAVHIAQTPLKLKEV